MKPIAAILGAGSFGTAMANIIARNGEVWLWGRNPAILAQARATGKLAGQDLHPQVRLTDQLSEAAQADIILPIIPSHAFSEVIKQLVPHLRPTHFLVHGTKGLDPDFSGPGFRTMSGILNDLTGLDRIGCLAGPNLAREMAEDKPTATVVASSHPEVLQVLPEILRTPRFQVLIGDDLLGIELCGVLKNIMAIPAGALHTYALGENAKALLVNRCMVEMIHLGLHMGAALRSFLGVAGFGDLMATCSSSNSRNFTVGRLLAEGKNLTQIRELMDETAEGVNTARVVHHLAQANGWKAPITRMVYRVLFEDYPPEDAINLLMKLPLKEDIDFI